MALKALRLSQEDDWSACSFFYCQDPNLPNLGSTENFRSSREPWWYWAVILPTETR